MKEIINGKCLVSDSSSLPPLLSTSNHRGSGITMRILGVRSGISLGRGWTFGQAPHNFAHYFERPYRKTPCPLATLQRAWSFFLGSASLRFNSSRAFRLSPPACAALMHYTTLLPGCRLEGGQAGQARTVRMQATTEPHYLRTVAGGSAYFRYHRCASAQPPPATASSTSPRNKDLS